MNQPAQVYEFGEFRLDPDERLLIRAGQPVPLAPKTFDTLVLLVENAGRLVPKDEFIHRLWPGTFVEEVAVAQNVSQLRKALDNGGGGKSLIETVPKRGYRFVASVVLRPKPGAPPHQTAEVPVELPLAAQAVASGSPARSRRWGRVRIAIGVLAAVTLIAVAIGLPQPAPPRVTRITRLTGSERVDVWGKLVSDGARLYYLERDGAHWNLMQTPVTGGGAQPFPGQSRNVRILAISPDNSEFLMAHFDRRDAQMQFTLMPAVGGAERPLPGIAGGDAAWSSDGATIAFTKGSELWVMNRDGSNPRRIASMPDRTLMPAWSPDCLTIRFTTDHDEQNRSLWEVRSNGSDLRRVFAHDDRTSTECCGVWTPDGRYFLYQAAIGGRTSLWSWRQPRMLFAQRAASFALTNDDFAFTQPVVGKDAARVFAFGSPAWRRDLMVVDPKSKKLDPILPEERPFIAAFSRDGDSLFFVENTRLWRSRADGSERRSVGAGLPPALTFALSPSGEQVAVVAQQSGLPRRIFIIATSGGVATEATSMDGNFTEPDWAPDGASLIATRDDAKNPAGPSEGVYRIDLGTRGATKLPGSEGLRSPRWSPDGRHVAALTSDQRRVMLFAVRTSAWTEIADGNLASDPHWSADGESIYFQDLLAEGEPIYRLRLRDLRKDIVFSFDEQLRADAMRCGLVGMTHNGRFIVTVDRSGADIYALDLSLP
ncbi:MAG TPA: winged helix-turn-helix domain-containing protein [Candidatus Sulfotelmatobacter sp.]|nr:winged helix-turn-helix domain-containing protein [Candidatus Sulfotelmatobacter sp.]